MITQELLALITDKLTALGVPIKSVALTRDDGRHISTLTLTREPSPGEQWPRPVKVDRRLTIVEDGGAVYSYIGGNYPELLADIMEGLEIEVPT